MTIHHRILEENNHKTGRGCCRYLFHLSDIHIRLNSRMQEYREVFARVRDLLGTYPRDTGVVVITGDVLHCKAELSPESIVLTRDFVRGLADLFPVIMIMGNHDAVLNNRQRMDSLSAIFEGQDIPNFHYLPQTGFYNFRDLVFAVQSLRDGGWLRAEEWSGPGTKIALYHGGVGRFRTNLGFEMEGSRSCADFEGYDRVLLGDIHQFQYLDPEKHMAYAGSLVAQNFGELDPDHGVLVWDLEEDNSTLHRIPNDYAFCQARLQGDRVRVHGAWYALGDPRTPFPPKGHVRLITSDEGALLRIAALQETHPDVRFILHSEERRSPDPDDHNNDAHKEDSDTAPDLVTEQARLIREYCERAIPEPTEERDAIVRRILLGLQARNAYCAWRLERLTFSNLFGYGEDNSIDFRSMPGVLGIEGKNSVGKSSLIDILCFALFGRISRQTHLPKELVHRRKTSFRCEVFFSIGGTRYCVQKHGKMDKKGQLKRIEEKVYEVGPDDRPLRDLTDEDRIKTDKKVLLSKIGSLESFLYTSVFLQSRERSFRDMTQKEKKEFLYRLLNLDWFEDFHQEVHSEALVMKRAVQRQEKELASIPYLTHTKELEMIRTELERRISRVQDKQTILETWRREESSLGSALLEFDSPFKKLSAEEIAERLHALGPEDDDEEDDDNEDKEEEEDMASLYRELGKVVTLNDERYVRYREEMDYWEELAPRQAEYQALESEYAREIQRRYEECVRVRHPDDRRSLCEEELAALRETYANAMSTQEAGAPLFTEGIEEALAEAQKTVEAWLRYEEELEVSRSIRWNPRCRMCDENPVRKRHLDILAKQTDLRARAEEILTIVPRDVYPVEWERLRASPTEALVRYRHQKAAWKRVCATCADLVERIRILEEKVEDYDRLDRIVVLERERHDKLEPYHRWLGIDRKRDTYTAYLEMYERNEEQKKKNAEIQVRIDRQKRYQASRERRQLTETLEYFRDRKIWEKHRDKVRTLEEDIQQTLLDIRDKRATERRLVHEIGRYEEGWKAYEAEKKSLALSQQTEAITHRDGLPLFLLQYYVPLIEKRLNHVARSFLDKEILFSMEGNDLLFRTRREGYVFQFYGGMESFVMDMATKIVFSQMASFPRCSVFIIDEGISVLDKEHLHNIADLFDFLRRYYEHVLIISHLNLRDVLEKSVLIEKDADEYSRIVC